MDTGERFAYQVLVFPYRVMPDGKRLYALLKRIPDVGGFWQAVGGGAEPGETPLETAKRETFEETGISPESEFFALDSVASLPLPVRGLSPCDGRYVLPEYCFAVRVESEDIQLSGEHVEYLWLEYPRAVMTLYWESNRTALWELECRLRRAAGDLTTPRTPWSLLFQSEPVPE